MMDALYDNADRPADAKLAVGVPWKTGGAHMPPFGTYVIMAPRSAIPGAPVHYSPIAKRPHTTGTGQVQAAKKTGASPCPTN